MIASTTARGSVATLTAARAAAPGSSRPATVLRAAARRPAPAPTMAKPHHTGLHRRLFGLGSVLGMGILGSGAGPARAKSFAAAPDQIAEILETAEFPDEWPYRPEDLSRYDESSDYEFYEAPRFVTHIDDEAIKSLTKYYEETFPASGQDDVAILDVCSSWISHYPKGYTAGRISGLGMNEEELVRNKVLTDHTVADLNENPVLPYEDNTFDVVTNAVSVDYLTKPLEVFKEMQRVLKPGGTAVMSFSNRCFPTKAIAIWTQTGDPDHCWIVGSYFHYAGGFSKAKAAEITNLRLRGRVDPMYVVYATKEA